MRKRLPHVDAPGHVQHIVFCVRGAFTAALPNAPDRIDVADRALDESQIGRILLGHAADAVLRVLLFGIPDQYRLHAWCVMPNHVHALVAPNPGIPAPLIVQRWKSISARAVNRLLDRDGALWQANYFDRYMRDEAQLTATAEYIERNPVVAGLVERPCDWRWSSAWMDV